MSQDTTDEPRSTADALEQGAHLRYQTAAGRAAHRIEGKERDQL